MESSRLILSRIGAAYSVYRNAFAAFLAVGALLLIGGPASAQDSAAPLPLDLAIRTGLHRLGIGHPEACLLGVYRRRGATGR